ncbi:glutathione S-transferase 1-like [Uloborus diversus]|uniref:glutathione S-transferase 1-like n=1 Tax=Uloborus diversus TaxID=327109 RepID=UPI00240A06D2|nr:glutathione S-transferase 1-like [Uloborus diversus]
MVIILYMMEISPPCRAVLMTIKYLGLQAELREENLIIGNSNRHPEFLKINPRSCVPTIDDDGFYLWESRAIMTYLVNKYAPCSPIYPKDPKKRALVDMMLNFDQGTLYRSQVEYLYPLIFRGEPPDLSKETSYRNSLCMLEQSLQLNAYVAGKRLTLADFSIVASISLAEIYDYNFKPFPRIVEWLKRLKTELPFYREINEVPLFQFKFWYRPYSDSDEDMRHFDINLDTTRL